MANNNDRTLPPLIYRLQTGPYAGKTLDEVPSFYCKELMTGGESELAWNDSALFDELVRRGYTDTRSFNADGSVRYPAEEEGGPLAPPRGGQAQQQQAQAQQGGQAGGPGGVKQEEGGVNVKQEEEDDNADRTVNDRTIKAEEWDGNAGGVIVKEETEDAETYPQEGRGY